jgi:hypothetical protein
VDRITEPLWRETRSPFDGLTLVTPMLSSRELLVATASVVRLLHRACPGVTLTTAQDWHEHDGFVTEAAAASWDQLEEAVHSEDALMSWTPLDPFVRRAWLGRDSFYLRWHYFDGYERPFHPAAPAGGDLDLTGAAPLVRRAQKRLRAAGIESETEAAKTFFARRLYAQGP